MIPEQRTIRLTISGIPYATMTAVGYDDQVGGTSLDIPVPPDKALAVKIFITAPAQQVETENMQVLFKAADLSSAEADSYSAAFAAPKKGQ
jgi:hypothetical protein